MTAQDSHDWVILDSKLGDFTDKIKVINKQNITRDIEVKNNLTIASGEWGGDSGERRLQELL